MDGWKLTRCVFFFTHVSLSLFLSTQLLLLVLVFAGLPAHPRCTQRSYGCVSPLLLQSSRSQVLRHWAVCCMELKHKGLVTYSFVSNAAF